MISRRLASLATVLTGAVLLAGCGDGSSDNGSEPSETITIKIGAVTSPMTDIVEVADSAIEDGYRIELVEVSDYVLVNNLLKDGDIQANFAQHVPFMEEFNEKNDADLQAVQPVYNFIIAFYSKDYDSIEELPDGARVAIPDDASNTARALKLLADADLIQLDPEIDPYTATLDDITENPKSLTFQQLAIRQLNTAYEEADLVYQWPSHIIHLGLNPHDHGLITELDDHFALEVVVAEGTDEATIAALRKAFSSDAVRDLIEDNPAIEVAF